MLGISLQSKKLILTTIIIISLSSFLLYTFIPLKSLLICLSIFISLSLTTTWNIFFLSILPLVILFFSFAVILVKNPIYSLFSLITIFFCSVILLLYHKNEFLSILFLIIYIGAIAILFLFVIMMFNLKELQQIPVDNPLLNISLFLFLILSAKFFFIIELVSYQNLSFAKLTIPFPNMLNMIFEQKNYIWIFDDILYFSLHLYTTTALSFLTSTYILLIAMVGAIVLALHGTSLLNIQKIPITNFLTYMFEVKPNNYIELVTVETKIIIISNCIILIYYLIFFI